MLHLLRLFRLQRTELTRGLWSLTPFQAMIPNDDDDDGIEAAVYS